MSRDELIAEFRNLDALSRDPLGAADLPTNLWLTLRRHFGSIDAAREAAGVRAPERELRWSEEAVLAEIRNLHAKGVRITDLGLKDEHAGLLSAIRIHIGSIGRARRLARVPEPVPVTGKRQRWDEDRVIQEIEELDRTGESIAASKVPNALLKAGKRYFGSWGHAVEAAGFDYSEVRLMHEPYAEEDLVEALRELAKREPEMPWSDLHRQSFAPTVMRLFGSFEAALARARLIDWPVRERLRAMSRDEVLAAIRKRERVGRDTNWEAVNTDNHHLWYSGILHFGEWRRAVEAAGADTRDHNRRWTTDKLLDALRERDRQGLSLQPEDVKRDDSRLFASVLAYFGSYVRAVERVAYTPWALTRWTPELVIERLRTVANGRGRVTAREAGGNLAQAAQLHFGSYSAACRAAGLEVVVALRGTKRGSRRAANKR